VNELQWWCAARTSAWSWEWQPYPGVWLFVAAVALIYWRVAWSHRAGETHGRIGRKRRVAGVFGLLLLWATLDWPIGALGAGYLASVHAFQYMSLALFVPLLLLLGVEPGHFRRLQLLPAPMREILRRSTTPFFSGIFFATVLIGTHAGPVVDRLMVTQLGSFLIDVLWLKSGFLFWWPLVSPYPERERFHPPLRIIYVFLATVPHVFIAMWMLLASLPIYGAYELAPPFPGIGPVADQQLAGGVLLLVGSPFIVATISTIFFRWQREEG
jgi:cytochrome c oxidase assembly factor CtaG